VEVVAGGGGWWGVETPSSLQLRAREGVVEEVGGGGGWSWVETPSGSRSRAREGVVVGVGVLKPPSLAHNCQPEGLWRWWQVEGGGGGLKPPPARVQHGYTAGRNFPHRTRTRRHRTLDGYG